MRRNIGPRTLLLALTALAACMSGAAQALPFARLPDEGARFNHGPGVVSLGQGALLACWYSGTGERSRDSVVRCARSVNGARDWMAPSIAVKAQETARFASGPDKSVGNAVLARDAVGRVILFYGVVQSRKRMGFETCRNWNCGGVNFKVSSDGGRTWSAPARLDGRMGALPRSGVLHTAAADLLPLYLEGGASSVASLSLPSLDSAAPQMRATPIPARAGVIQPSLAAGAQGEVFAFMRDQKKQGVFVSRLKDGKWSPAALTPLPNPGAAVEAFSDRTFGMLLIYNPSASNRAALALSRTRDGAKFDGVCALTEGAALGDVAYPSVAQIDADHWALVFSAHDKKTIQATVIDRAWIAHCLGAG